MPEAIVSAISVTFNLEQEYNVFCFYRNLIGYVTQCYDDVLRSPKSYTLKRSVCSLKNGSYSILRNWNRY